MYYIFPLRKNVAYQNLQVVFKNKSKRDLNKIIRKTYMHYGLIMTEFIRNSSSKINEKTFSLSENSLSVLNSKKGIILMTAHIGNWEMILPIIGSYKKIMAVVKEQTNSGGDNFFHKARAFKNVKLVSKKSSKNTKYRKKIIKKCQNHYKSLKINKISIIYKIFNYLSII